MGSFDDKAEEHGVVMAQPVGVVPSGANTSVVTGGEARREEGDPSPHSGTVFTFVLCCCLSQEKPLSFQVVMLHQETSFYVLSDSLLRALHTESFFFKPCSDILVT